MILRPPHPPNGPFPVVRGPATPDGIGEAPKEPLLLNDPIFFFPLLVGWHHWNHLPQMRKNAILLHNPAWNHPGTTWHHPGTTQAPPGSTGSLELECKGDVRSQAACLLPPVLSQQGFFWSVRVLQSLPSVVLRILPPLPVPLWLQSPCDGSIENKQSFES